MVNGVLIRKKSFKIKDSYIEKICLYEKKELYFLKNGLFKGSLNFLEDFYGG